MIYTGDFKLDGSFAAEPCEPPRADVLIMETTFGLPRYVFPPAGEMRARIIDFCRQALAEGATPMLIAYSLGKSQELLRVLDGTGLPVMLHAEAYRLTRVYEELGVGFPPYRPFAPDAAAGHVVICPFQWGPSPIPAAMPKPRVAVVTGWAVDSGAIPRYRCDAAFPLSDHADFPGLLALVDRVRPRVVFTVHGFAREFAQTLRARGQEAWALGADNQLELGLPL